MGRGFTFFPGIDCAEIYNTIQNLLKGKLQLCKVPCMLYCTHRSNHFTFIIFQNSKKNYQALSSKTCLRILLPRETFLHAKKIPGISRSSPQQSALSGGAKGEGRAILRGFLSSPRPCESGSQGPQSRRLSNSPYFPHIYTLYSVIFPFFNFSNTNF